MDLNLLLTLLVVVLVIVVAIVYRRATWWVIGGTWHIAAASARWMRHRSSDPSRVVRWCGRHMGRIVALVGAHGPRLFVWRRASARKRALVRSLVNPVLHPWIPAHRQVFTPSAKRRLSIGGVNRVVTGDEQVRVALESAGAITTTMRTPYAERLDSLHLWFVLGEDRIGEIQTGRNALRSAAPDGRPIPKPGDELFDKVVLAAGRRATSLVGASGGRIDVVEGLIVPACTAAVRVLLEPPGPNGDSEAAGSELSDEELFASLQLLLHRTFLNPNSPLGRSDWGAERAARLVARKLVEKLGTSHESADATSTRIMLATAAGPHVAWVASHVIDELLRHPRETRLTDGWGAAVVPDEAARARRIDLVLEAMRYSPVVPGVVRVCPIDAELEVSGHTRRLRPGAYLVHTRAAEFTRLESLRFRPTRHAGQDPPPAMSFGYGMHRCLGKELALALIVAIIDPLFQHENVRRAAGRSGRLSTTLPKFSPLRHSGDWPFPTHLEVTFNPGIGA